MRAVWIASIAGAAFCAVVAVALPAHAADRLILRDLTILVDRQVEGFDEDGVRLDDDTTLTWDRIERGSIAADKQAEFDRLRDEIGRPLFQLRVRLRVGDDLGLAEPAERLAQRFAERDGASAYLVQRALMRARLAAGKREAAVEPYLRCLAAVWNPTGGRAAELPVELRMRFDADTGLSPELLPVWFDAAAARDALPGVRQAAAKFAEPRPDALRIYFGALAAAAGERETAERAISGIGGADPAKEAGQRANDWRDVLRLFVDASDSPSDSTLAQLDARLASLAPLTRPVAYYGLGLARLRSPQVESQWDGVLCLLRLPAAYGVEQPELAAAALTASADALEKLGDKPGAETLRRERAVRYARIRLPQREDSAPAKSAAPASVPASAKPVEASAPAGQTPTPDDKPPAPNDQDVAPQASAASRSSR